ncbi:MAG TPA: hypothetical protein PLL75_05455 [Candidatus Omnitrophota bacterium]|nr:hypothetical protein [Candidatus Omnitrophota bacterium]
MMFFRKIFFFLITILTLSFAAPFALAAPSLVYTDVTKRVYARQKMTLTLVIEWPVSDGELQFKVPEESLKLNNLKFEVLTRTQDGDPKTSQLTLVYELLPLEVGPGKIQSFNLRYKNPSAINWKTFLIPEFNVDVKPAFPWGTILFFLFVLTAIILPASIWLIHMRKKEQLLRARFLADPRQQVYDSAAKDVDGFVSGFDEAFLNKRLAMWTEALKKVAMTRYGVPVRPATAAEILRELESRGVGVAELNEITDLFNRISRIKFSTEASTGKEVEETQQEILKYIRSLLITENPQLQ